MSAPNNVIFERGPSDGSAWYLLEGEVMLDIDGQVRSLTVESTNTRYPFAAGRFYEATVTASSEVRILVLPESMMLASLQKKTGESNQRIHAEHRLCRASGCTAQK